MTFSQHVQLVINHVTHAHALNGARFTFRGVCAQALETMVADGMDPTPRAVEAVAKAVWAEVPATHLRF